MAAPNLITLFDSNASPQTGVDNGDSTVFQVWNTSGALEKALFTAVGTWQSASLKFYVSTGGTSPLEWAPAQIVANDGTMADAVLTANGSLVLDIPTGGLVKATISGGSPAPALRVRGRGNFVANPY